jgi:uncharacterized protein (TIGR00255 family)
MLQSMTGFGKAVKELAGGKITAEIKTLNSKNQNITIHLPEVWRDKENDLKNKISSRLERGKIDVYLKIESLKQQQKVTLNRPVIDNYYTVLSEIFNIKEHSAHDEQIFQIIMRLPEVFKVSEDEFDSGEWNFVLETLDKAIDQTLEFRIQEGAALEKDLTEKLSVIEKLIPEIEPFEKERIVQLREKLKKKIDEIFVDKKTDTDRFEQEIIFYLEKMDINEEKIRLRNHCDYFRQTLNDKEAPGRKLGFITQEIGREINTLGSKASHYEIQKAVVKMKDELEKIKEQILNIL